MPLWKLWLFNAALEISADDPASLGVFMLAGAAPGVTDAVITRTLAECGP